MQINIRFISMLVLWLIASFAIAQNPSFKGMATVPFSGSKPSPTQYAEALRLAKINAIEKYFSGTNAAEQKNYDLIRKQISVSVDDFVLSHIVLSEEADKAAKSLTLVIRADLNAVRLGNALQAASATQNTDQSQRSPLTFVFVSRVQQSVKSFRVKSHERVDTSASTEGQAAYDQEGEEGEGISASSIGTSERASIKARASANTSSSVTSGGSDELKSDEIAWKVGRAAEVNSVVTGIFSNAGYEVIEAEFLEEETNKLINLAEFRKDYSTGDDLSSTTLRNAAKGAQAVKVPYLAIGTLDIGVRDIDPASGLSRVYVSVSGKVINVSGRFPKTVSAVGPVQFSGLGPNETVARTNALQLAAENAAKQMVNELNAKGVQ